MGVSKFPWGAVSFVFIMDFYEDPHKVQDYVFCVRSLVHRSVLAFTRSSGCAECVRFVRTARHGNHTDCTTHACEKSVRVRVPTGGRGTGSVLQVRAERRSVHSVGATWKSDCYDPARSRSILDSDAHDVRANWIFAGRSPILRRHKAPQIWDDEQTPARLSFGAIHDFTSLAFWTMLRGVSRQCRV